MSDKTTRLKKALARAELFEGWDDILLELVASISEERTYQRGDLIFAENSPGDELYVIVSGEITIQVNPGMIEQRDPDATMGPYQTIATLRAGQNFGEVALLDQGLRSAAAVCTDFDTHVIAIPRDRLLVMCENVPRLGYALMYNLAADLAMKIRNTDIQIRAVLTWTPSHRTT
ncbi:MAG: cyclic nucleotide-binding domain-containing protein [Anaerolineales bacterium]